MAVHKENIVMAALHTLVMDGVDMGATFEPLTVTADMEVREITTEDYITPVDDELTLRTFSAEVVFAEVTKAQIAIVWNLPSTNIVSSSTMLLLDENDRGLVSWIAVGKNGSMPNGETRTFNFNRARVIGSMPYNMAKLEPTRMPTSFKFYADRANGLVGSITDTESNFMLFDTARSSPVIDLTGAAVTGSMYNAVNPIRVTLIRVIYEEATSSHTGVLLTVGKTGDADWFASYTTEINQPINTVKQLTLLNDVLLAGESLTFTYAGFKAGTGIITIQVELEAWLE